MLWILMLPVDFCYLIIGSALTTFLVLIEMGCCHSKPPDPKDNQARSSVSSSAPFIVSSSGEGDVVTSQSHASLTSGKNSGTYTIAPGPSDLLLHSDEVSQTFDTGEDNNDVPNLLSPVLENPSATKLPAESKHQELSVTNGNASPDLPEIHSDKPIPTLELWKSVEKAFGTPKTNHRNSNSTNVDLHVNIEAGDTYSHSSNEVKVPKDTDDTDLSFLAPVCKLSEKEVVSLGDETSVLKEETQQIDNLVYLVVAFKFFELLVTPMAVSALALNARELTEQMRNALNRIIADSFQLRIKVFVVHFNKVFLVHDDLVSRHSKGKEWLELSIMATLKGLLQDFIKLGRKSLPELCKYLTLSLGATDIPWLGSVTEDNLRAFISSCDNLFGFANDVVFLMPNLSKKSSLSVDQNSGKQVSSFFKTLLDASAIPYTELSLVLSRESPELLAALVDRTPNGLLTLLLKDGSFKCEQGMVMLKGFVPVSPIKAANLEPQIVSPSSSVKSSPSKKLNELRNGELNQVSDTKTVKEASNCICSSGIVMCVGKSRTTFWCSQSDACKNMFIFARRNKTLVDEVLDRNFLTVFKEGDKVIFTHETVSGEGWTIDYALRVKIVSDVVRQTNCICPEKKDISRYHSKVSINNGIPFKDKSTFFWNCKGSVINMMNTKGIVKCMLSSTSDQYFLTYFTNSTWFVGFEPSKCNFADYLTIGDSVEVDIVLQNYGNSGTLSWFCLCLRKLANATYFPASKILWNCTGKVYCVLRDGYLLTRNSDPTSDMPETVAPFRNILLHKDGFAVTCLTSESLKVNEKLHFDLIMGEQSIAMFLRKCRRPDVEEPKVVENNSTLVALKIQEELSSDVPFFDSLSGKCSRNSVTFGECREVLERCPEVAKMCQKIPIDHLSLSHSIRNQLYQSNQCNYVKSLTDTSCQTISTGPIFSALSPT